MNGHIAEDELGLPPALRGEGRDYCPECGARRIGKCPSCTAPIELVPTGYLNDYDLPDFCERCGGWFPWTSREKRVGALYNLIDYEEGLEEVERLEIVKQIAILTTPEDEAEEPSMQIEAGNRLRSLSPALWESARQVLVDILSTAARQGLGL